MFLKYKFSGRNYNSKQWRRVYFVVGSGTVITGPHMTLNILRSMDWAFKCSVLFQVYCEVCAKYSTKAKGDVRLRGTALAQKEKYTTGSNYVTLHNIKRHIGGLAHKLCKEYRVNWRRQ